MANNTWLSVAPDLPQVQSYLFGGTWEANDIIRATIGTVSVDFVAGSTTIATVIDNLIAAWALLDEDAYPQFAEITPTRSTSTLLLTSEIEGKFFVVTLTPLETNGSAADAQTIEGIGTATTGTASTANSGKNDVNVVSNWSDGLPNASDDVHFDVGGTDRSAMYQLGAFSAVTLTSLNFFGSFTGDVGLPRIDAEGDYYQYRDDYFVVSATTINVSITGGTGSGRIKVNTGSVATTVNVFGTGSSSDPEVRAFVWKGTSASNTMRVEGGSVDVAPYGGETANLAGGVTMNGGDLRTGPGVTLSGTHNQAGGTWDSSSALGTLNMNGGLHIHRTGTVTALVLNDGTFDVRSKAAMTITDLTIGPTGVLDLTNAIGAVTVTNTAVLRPGATILDPHNRLATTFTYSCVGGPNSVNVSRGQAAATVAIS